MILSNTRTDTTVPLPWAGGTIATVTPSIDVTLDNAPLVGYSVVGNGKRWLGTPSPHVAISVLGTLGSGTTIVDWTTAGYCTFTARGGAFTLSFTNAAGVLTPNIGNVLRMRITHAGSAACTWPGTISWLGSGSTSAPTLTSQDTDIILICTSDAPGADTYDGTWVTG